MCIGIDDIGEVKKGTREKATVSASFHFNCFAHAFPIKAHHTVTRCYGNITKYHLSICSIHTIVRGHWIGELSVESGIAGYCFKQSLKKEDSNVC